MAIKKIRIQNFKKFRNFTLDFTDGLNILVGENGAGKSTILEAINLALTGIVNGKHLSTELTQYLFNKQTVDTYLENPQKNLPPKIIVELYLDPEKQPDFVGGINLENSNNASGVTLTIELKENDEYRELVKSGEIKSLPIEYYEYEWRTFADKVITTRSIDVKSALIDSSTAKYQNGSDVYISRIIRQELEDIERVRVAQAHRTMIEFFGDNEHITKINTKLTETASISKKNITLSAELLSKNAWEASLVTCVDSVPFQYIGKGEQAIIKTGLALKNKKSQKASVMLIEEPENHLTYTKLNELLSFISESCEEKQIIVSTHSSFVANKLGLDNLILLGSSSDTLKFDDLTAGTSKYFSKVAGYDTLRLVLSKASILVEGSSDELVVQKAYALANGGKLPIEDGVDVITVNGLTFKRYLEIADILKRKVAIVTDNDGDIPALQNKYAQYLGDNLQDHIMISYDGTDRTEKNGLEKYNYNTLENLIILENGLDNLNEVLGQNRSDLDDLRKYMKNNKADTALDIFLYEGDTKLKFPRYITEAIAHVK